MKTIFKIIIFLISLKLSAQHYSGLSQYMLNGLVLNPSSAGSSGCLDAKISERIQWVGFKGAPNTTSFSIHSPLRKQKLNIGLIGTFEKLGPYKIQTVQSCFAYRLKLKKIQISAGIQIGIINQTTNWANITKNDEIDVLLNYSIIQSTAITSGFGIYIHNNKFYFGTSMPYFYNSKQRQVGSYNPLLITGGYVLDASKTHQLKPSFLIKWVENSPVQIDLNLNYYYNKKIGCGFSYRHKESIVGILDYFINNQFKISYSYDYNISKLSNYQHGSHELLLRYQFKYLTNNQNPRYFF